MAVWVERTRIVAGLTPEHETEQQNLSIPETLLYKTVNLSNFQIVILDCLFKKTHWNEIYSTECHLWSRYFSL